MYSRDLWITLSYQSTEKNPENIKCTFAKSTEQIIDRGGRLFLCIHSFIHSLCLIHIVLIGNFWDHLLVTWQSTMFKTMLQQSREVRWVINC